MPTGTTRQRARRQARRGRPASTQAGEYVRSEMRKLKRGRGSARSRKQAVAIGLSEARRDGVPLRTPGRGKATRATQQRARRDRAVGQGQAKVSPTRSAAARKAARTRAKRSERAR
jgi:hypothetical protein